MELFLWNALDILKHDIFDHSVIGICTCDHHFAFAGLYMMLTHGGEDGNIQRFLSRFTCKQTSV